MPSCGRNCSTRPRRHRIEWHWVKGHSGHPENDRVDALACAEADKQRALARIARGRRTAPDRCRRPSDRARPSSSAAASFAAAGAVWMPKPPCPAHQKKPGSPRIEAVDRQPVGREAAQAGPAALDRLDRPVDHLLEPVDRGGDVDFFGRGVARVAVDLVVRAEPDAAVAFALEIESAGRSRRSAAGPQAPSADSQLDHRPPLRRDARAARRRTLPRPRRPRRRRH